MKIPIPFAALVAFTIAATSNGWAQGAPAGASARRTAQPDEIVRMHQQIAAANREYEHEVAAARDVFYQKKSIAAKKRDAAIEAAHQGVAG